MTELPEGISVSMPAYRQSDETMVTPPQINGLPGQMETASHLFCAESAAFGLQDLLLRVQATKLGRRDDIFIAGIAWHRYRVFKGRKHSRKI